MTINESPRTVGAVQGVEVRTSSDKPSSSTKKPRRKGKRRKLTEWHLRGVMPYGIWRERGTGDLIIFNRNYTPIWRRTPDGVTTPVTDWIGTTGKFWIEWDRQIYCYEGQPSPWCCEKTRKWCEWVLRMFDVPDDAPWPKGSAG
jgi:hypothetical protein